MNFDRIAPCYSFLEKIAFGEALQSARTHYLNFLAERRNVLLLGEGRGRLLRVLMDCNKDTQICVVEPSFSMFRTMKEFIPKKEADRVSLYNEPFEKFDAEGGFDAVCTCFFWDCFREDEIVSLLCKLAESLTSKGLWMNADFIEPAETAPTKRLFHSLLLRFLYGFFRHNCQIRADRLPPLSKLADEAGFGLVAKKTHHPWPLASELFERRTEQPFCLDRKSPWRKISVPF